MRSRWLALAGCLVAVSALGACGDDDEGGSTGASGGGDTGGEAKKVTIYSSLPFDPADRKQSEDVVKGMKLALKQVNNKVGDCTITYKSLDDSTAQAGQWDPGQTSSNARKAAQDKSAIAYLGEFNSGASAISIPILNQAGIAQISPSNTALELTKDIGPAGKGAPGKYYPTGKRHYARVVPADHIQGSAQAEWMKELGVKKLFLANDKQVYGAGVATATSDAAKTNGIEVAGNEGIDIKAANYRALAAKIKASGADAFFFGGITASNAVQLYKDVFAANPDIKAFGPDGVAETSFTKELPKDKQGQTYITVATTDPKEFGPEGEKFFKDFEAAYNTAKPEPYAIYGYEAMSLALDSIKRASDCADKAAVIDALFKTKERQSVIGTYSIDKDGDATINKYGRYLVKGGELEFNKTVEVTKDPQGNPLG